jgi:hypothetical protein
MMRNVCVAVIVIAVAGPAARAQQAAQYNGYIDVCKQNQIMGWAKNGSAAVPVTIVVNGRTVASVKPTLARPDVVKAFPGTVLQTGFVYDSISAQMTDKVEVRFPDGKGLPNSPCKLQAQ